MLGFIAGAIVGGALGILMMGILQTSGFDYQDEEDDDEEKRG